MRLIDVIREDETYKDDSALSRTNLIIPLERLLVVALPDVIFVYWCAKQAVPIRGKSNLRLRQPVEKIASRTKTAGEDIFFVDSAKMPSQPGIFECVVGEKIPRLQRMGRGALAFFYNLGIY